MAISPINPKKFYNFVSWIQSVNVLRTKDHNFEEFPLRRSGDPYLPHDYYQAAYIKLAWKFSVDWKPQILTDIA